MRLRKQTFLFRKDLCRELTLFYLKARTISMTRKEQLERARELSSSWRLHPRKHPFLFFHLTTFSTQERRFKILSILMVDFSMCTSKMTIKKIPEDCEVYNLFGCFMCSFGSSGEAMGLKVGHDTWRKVGVVFDGFAIAPNPLLNWVQSFVANLKGPNDTRTQLNILLKDGNSRF
jgi:hypothetical protein